MTQNEFIEKAKEIHGDKYDYSKVEYINTTTKVCIICSEHGEFWQQPRFHLYGHKCPICAHHNKKTRIKDTASFIQAAKTKHGDKYDYSKVNYINSTTKICIICPKHGEIWMTPHSHLKGGGCNLCAKPIHDTASFIEEAYKKHGNKYDYSKVEYVNAHTKVKIICPIHGEFWQTPNNHLSRKGQGCPICRQKKITDAQRLTTELFIEKAQTIHGDRYDYSKVEYGVNNLDDVTITCPIHGEFLQKPIKHLQGHGCPKCRYSHLERIVEQLLMSLNVKYIYQVNKTTLPWLGLMTLDFYLPEYNIAIECQGEQHYKVVRWGGKNMNEEEAIELFYTVQKRDKRKKEKCQTNNCLLIYFTKPKLAQDNEITNIEDLKKLLLKIIS